MYGGRPACVRWERIAWLAILFWAVFQPRAAQSADGSPVERDWLLQAGAALFDGAGPATTWADAAGAVDGVKDGRYAFHTGHQPRPWWQVDLGEPTAVARLLVYNRLDYAPGLHNADELLVLTSADGAAWTERYDNAGRHFGGAGGAPPLEVRFDPPLEARYVRLQVKRDQAVFFHLDEVEIYGPGDPRKNLALHHPCDQSSTSQWSTAKPGALPPPVTYPVADVLRRAGREAEILKEQGIDTAPADAELAALAGRWAALPADAPPSDRQTLYLEARRVLRRLVFADPLLDFREILFVKRFTQEAYPDVCLNHMPWVSRPGGDIALLTLAGPDAEPAVRTLLNGGLGPGHVHGIDLAWEADRVVFGYARTRTAEPPEGWLDRATNYDLRRNEEAIHLYEIGIDGRGLRQITDGPWSDLDPTYAPNGDIVFVSERCGYSLQCNEWDKDETSCNLYCCKPDGSAVRWLSVSKDGDYLPHTLADGSIGYTRWEYQERGWANIQSIWFIRPDGTGADALFKQHLNDPWSLEDVRSIPGSRTSRLVAIAAGHHTLAAGPVVIVTPSVAMNEPQAIRIVTPDVRPPEGGMSGAPVDEGGVADAGGFYMGPWPLSPERFLVSYSYSSRHNEPAGYGLYLIDVRGNKELIYRDPGISSFTPIPLRPRPRPPAVPDLTDRGADCATLSLADAAHGVAGIAPGEPRYLRVAHGIAWPYDLQQGGHRYAEKATPNNWNPVEILGTVPLEADGSAHFQVPADVPVYFQLLDADGMELRRMRSFISFQPGEVRGCVGCHQTRAEAPPAGAFPVALLQDPKPLRPPPWGRRPVSFLRDVQPIFDRHCAACHCGLRPPGGLELNGGLTADRSGIAGYGQNRAFDSLLAGGWIACSPVQGDASITQPLAFGSRRSKLVEVLKTGACGRRATLSPEEWERLVTWIDANAPYHDRFLNKRPERPAYGLPNDRELLDRLADIHSRRCAACHAPGEVTRADWIDLHAPERSLFLMAPLPATAGGSGACGRAVYADTADADYRAVRGLVETAVQRAWAFPRRDLESLTEKP